MKANLNEEEKIREALHQKDWTEIKSSDSWQIFKIMAEFVEGYEKMAIIGPCVTIFGSARTNNKHPYYKLAQDTAYKMAKAGRNDDAYEIICHEINASTENTAYDNETIYSTSR